MMLNRNISIAAGLAALLLVACQQQKNHEPEPQEKADTPVVTTPRKTPKVKPAQTKEDTGAGENTVKADFPPVKVESYVPKTPGRRVASVSVPGPYVALTFDDGPSADKTPKILNILKEHGAHATFFVAGENAVHNQSILARAVAEGNEIGAHTYSHINMLRSSDERIEREMERTNAIIEKATGRKPVLMRPPYGATNARLVNKMHNDYGQTSVLWDVDTQDWRHPGVGTVIRRAVGNARPGSIILVHDIHASTLAAVEGIVTGLQARGFKLVTVSELLALAGGNAAPADNATGAETSPSEPQQEQPAAPATLEETNTGAASITVGQ